MYNQQTQQTSAHRALHMSNVTSSKWGRASKGSIFLAYRFSRSLPARLSTCMHRRWHVDHLQHRWYLAGIYNHIRNQSSILPTITVTHLQICRVNAHKSKCQPRYKTCHQHTCCCPRNQEKLFAPTWRLFAQACACRGVHVEAKLFCASENAL